MSNTTRILLIDDDEIFLKIAKIRFSKKLSSESIEVDIAISLSEIEEKMNADFDLIFIDLNMPQITGWQVIEKYKEKLKSPSCKAFICSSSIDPRDHERAASMSDIIEKMISKPIDIELVKSYLK